MAECTGRTHPVSVGVYKRHIRLVRYLNDTWIFTALMRPELKEQADILRSSKSKAKKKYPVPKKDSTVTSRRYDSDLGQIYFAQYDRGIFETNIISIVSRVEAFIQECMTIAISQEPKKLAIIGDKGIPLDLFLASETHADLLRGYIALRCQDLMFGKPTDYLAKAQKVLSISIGDSVSKKFIEMKASRDVIIHNQGEINQIYLDKVTTEKRGKVGDELVIDADYFGEVVRNAKLLSGAIQRETERKYK